MRRPLFALLLWFGLASAARADGTFYTLVTNGPAATHLNVVFFSEGYTNGQNKVFTNQALQFGNYIRSTPPFDQYSNYFNIFAIFVASVDSGSDHPLSSNLKNTYFNSTYYSYGTERLITIPPNNLDGKYADGQGKIYTLLQQWMPQYDLPVVIVNDSEYGGSGGAILVVSTNASSPEIAVHELGHTFAKLGDEYTSAYPGYPNTEEPNTTRETRRDFVKWNSWINPTTPVPTPDTSPYSSLIGLFEGAHYQTTGWYRPKHDCKMRTLGQPYCSVCAEQMVVTLYSSVYAIAEVFPGTNLFTLAPGGGTNLSAVIRHPAGQKLNIQWLLNGVPISNATNAAFNLKAADLHAGTNEIRMRLNDPTPLVHAGPDGLFVENAIWRVNVLNPPPSLQIERQAEGLKITASEILGNTLLESAASPSALANDWTPTSTLTADTELLVSPTNAVRFFRLRKL